ncbi:unnamed protein product [Amoebophrya sp. A120]|nr:unnamed protein product [Amoebophrya sp. A120]|eukprot:GSA120T00007572001.1
MARKMEAAGKIVSLQQTIRKAFSDAIHKAFPKVPLQEAKIVVAQPRFGDYQCNNAMDLFSQYRGDTEVLGQEMKTAGDIGNRIKDSLADEFKNKMFKEISVAPAGFISVRIDLGWINEKGLGLLSQSTSASSQKQQYETDYSKRVVVDFSSPNIAKEMHVGHLRSTIIGEAMCRVLEFCGHDVTRLNHVGDWGTQFGMLIEYMRETYPDFLENMPDISDLQSFYKASKKRFDDDADFKKRSQLSVVELQAGAKFHTEAWKVICEISRKSYQRVYDRLEINVTERGESYYNPMIPTVIKELEHRNIVVPSQGAKVITVPDVNPDVPLMVQKSDGGFCYGSTDLACIYHRLIVHRADWVIYITDTGQENHFWSVFDAAKQAGWHRPGVSRLDHMGFGVVQGEDGKKFKTRSGDTVKLEMLLDEAVSRAKVELEKRQEEAKKNGEAMEYDVDAAAEIIGYAAVKYFDLKQNRTSNYIFSFDRMLDPRGDTAVYLLYAYARICSIQRKAGFKSPEEMTAKIPLSKLNITEPEERNLLLEILKFPDVLESVLHSLAVHNLCEFLYKVVNLYTAFYMKCKVVGHEEQDSRLLLIELTRRTMKSCFDLLGCGTLERI